MARDIDAGVYAEINTAVVSSPPFTVSVFLKSVTAANVNIAWWCGDKDTPDDYFVLYGASAKATLVTRLTGTNDVISSTNTFADATYAHLCGRWTAIDDREVILNGDIANKGSSAVSAEPAGPDRTSLGRFGDSTSFPSDDGSLGECAVWGVALGDSEIGALSRGVSPLLIRPAALISYWPMIGRSSSEVDIVGGLNLTLVGSPAAKAHPRVIYPVAPHIITAVAAAGGVTLPIFDKHYRQMRAA